MIVYLVFAHFSARLTTKNEECQADDDPNQITQKCAFLYPWVSLVVVPLRQTDTNRLNRETRDEDTESTRACGALRAPSSLQQTS